MLFLCEARVNLGVNEQLAESRRHGYIWLKESGKKMPFMLDKPKLVERGLNFATWRRLSRQIEKMGFDATHLEIKIGEFHYCYRLDKYKELYAAGKGRPMWREVMA